MRRGHHTPVEALHPVSQGVPSHPAAQPQAGLATWSGCGHWAGAGHVTVKESRAVGPWVLGT